MSYTVTEIRALEILDSRGNPTLEVSVALDGGHFGVFGVPSGASTGSGEAIELRDGDADRYGGRGVTLAVAAVNGEIARFLVGRKIEGAADIDHILTDLDGTAEKHRLGANSIVGVSVASAKAMAAAEAKPLWQWLSGEDFTPRLPVPHFNVVNGGAHAANGLAFQEFMVAPLGASSYPAALRAGTEVYASLRRCLTKRGLNVGLGDEGGFAPDVDAAETVLDLLVEATTLAGYSPGRDDVAFALDPAATGFQVSPGRYRLGNKEITSSQLVDYYETLLDRFPIWSIEDGLAEDDHDGWIELTRRLGDRIQIVGDDNFVTNPSRIQAAQSDGVANAALIKVNQVGTLSETLEAIRVAEQGGYAAMISHRSGETSDSFIADLAVGVGCGQLKSGAPARGERVAKYNRLLQISHDADLDYGISAGAAIPRRAA